MAELTIKQLSDFKAYVFNKYLLSIFYMTGIFLGTGDKAA